MLDAITKGVHARYTRNNIQGSLITEDARATGQSHHLVSYELRDKEIQTPVTRKDFLKGIS